MTPLRSAIVELRVRKLALLVKEPSQLGQDRPSTDMIIKRQMHGRAGFALLRKRVIITLRNYDHEIRARA